MSTYYGTEKHLLCYISYMYDPPRGVPSIVMYDLPRGGPSSNMYDPPQGVSVAR